MQAWLPATADSPASAAPLAPTHLLGLAGVVQAVGQPGFAQQALGALNALVQAGSWSVYQTWRERPPVLYLSAARGVPDTTRDCFAAYQAGLYRRDRSFDVAAPLARAPGHAAVLHLRAEDMPNADHREAIYHRHGVVARMSLARREADGSLLAINLYRHLQQGAFSGIEIDRFRAAAPLLLAGVTRHIAWPGALAVPAPASPRSELRLRCSSLTERELDVCERLLQGLSYDGIAADLGLSVATVKTYRGRAFGRLGLHFKSELFALCRADRPA